MIEGKVDTVVVPETKVNSIFPTGQFYINVFTNICWLDRNRNGEGVFIYICEDIPSKKLENHIPSDIRGMFTERNLRKTEWLLFACYLPPYHSDNCFFYNIKDDLYKLSLKYNKYTCSSGMSLQNI